MIRRLIVPLTVAIVTLHAGQGFAQGAFPAPLPGPTPTPSLGAAPVPSSFPPAGAPWSVNPAFAAPLTQTGLSEDCRDGYLSLREEAVTRGQLIKVASERHASAEEACKLLGNFAQAEIRMIKYIESHAAQCGVLSEIADQVRSGHKNTEYIQQKVCAVARRKAPASLNLSEVLGPAPKGPSGPTGDFWIRGKQL